MSMYNGIQCTNAYSPIIDINHITRTLNDATVTIHFHSVSATSTDTSNVKLPPMSPTMTVSAAARE